MLVDLQWDKILENYAYELRKVAERYHEENTYHLLLIGDNQTGKTTFVNNIADHRFRNLPTEIPGIELSLLATKKELIHIWSMRTDPHLLEQLQERVHDIEGVIGFFDLTRPSSFSSLQNRVSDLIMIFGKMYPLILIGNKADASGRQIVKEDVLVYSYELGNCSCHRIPYVEMSALKNYGLDKVVHNMLQMINCNMTSRCSQFPAAFRQWCNVPQFYSFHKEPRQRLEVVS